MSDKTDELVWHYTYGHHFGEIVATGMLLPPLQVDSKVEAEMPHDYYESRAYKSDAKMLLFSSNVYWEPASYRGVADRRTGAVVDLHRRDDYERVGLKIYRFGVNRSILHPWMKLKRLAHMPHKMGQALEGHARRIGSNPYDWWGTLHPVGRNLWQTIEVLEGDTWQVLDSSELYRDQAA